MGNIFQYKTNKVSKKRVYYEGSDTLHKGYLLCYNYDTTTDMDGDTVSAGSDCNGKYLRVEKPATANCPYFAGVVDASADGVTGPAWIEIIEPQDTILQVYSAGNHTAGGKVRIQDDSYLASTSGVLIIGQVLETINRSSVNGLVTVRLGKQFNTTGSIIATAAKKVGSDLKTMLSDDTNYSDLFVLASDIRNIVCKVISDFAVAISDEYTA